MPTIALDLPWPPSVNRIWRSGGKFIYRSKEYTDWLRTAGVHWMMQRPSSKLKSINGEYSLNIILNPPDKRRRDLGNYEKVLSDFIQTAGIIEDDSLCQELHIAYGDKKYAPLGARLVIAPW